MGPFPRSGHRTASWSAVGRPRLIACLLATALLAGCDGEDPPPPYDGGNGGTTIPDEGCTSDYPDRLTSDWTGTDSEAYVDTVFACSASFAAETYIRNDSDAVFRVATTEGGTPLSHPDEDGRLLTFQEAASLVYDNPPDLLPPRYAMVVEAPPTEVSWTHQPQLSATWFTYDVLVDKVTQASEQEAITLFAAGSRRRRALVECSVTAYHAVGDAGALLDNPDAGKQLLAALGIGSLLSDCGRAWQAADDVTRSRGTTTTFTDDIIRLGDNLTFLRRVNTQANRWGALGRAVSRLLAS